ncbi:MAG: four helix bundle protein [Phycisphaerae bacterium]|nr:four helix bundle protein [Phycisphaerae bacterium]
MKENIVQVKSYRFALRIVKLYLYLKQEKKEYEIAKQVLRCGTSIGANIEEAIGGQSEKDFLAKIAIAYKECRETNYWIRLLCDSGFICENEKKSLIDDSNELLKIISSIQISMKRKMEIK